MHRRVVWRAVALLVAIATTSRAGVWHVKPDGSGDAPTIQAAIDAAGTGDSIVLAPGTYTWAAQGGDHVGLPGPSMINMRSGLTLRSELGPEATILDAQGNGRVIRCQSTSNVRIEGLTIQGGNAETAGLPGPFSMGVGGAILCKFGSAIISNNVIRNNHSRYNGCGLAVSISNTEILENVISWNNGEFGLYLSGGSTVVRGNTVASNTGGGVGFYQATGTFSENLVLDNVGGYELWCVDANVTSTCNNIWGSPSATTCSLGAGNFSEDPLICITSADYELRPDSPCLPENNGCGVLIGSRGVGCATTDVSEGRLPRAGIWVAASPNPFNPQTLITYALRPTLERVQLTVYDLRGRRVARLVDGQESGTTRSAIWNGQDERGRPAAAGVYVVRLDLGPDATTAKLVLAK